MKPNLLRTLPFCFALPAILGGCQLLVDNRSEGTTPVVVVTTEEWDKKVRDTQSFDMKPALQEVQKRVFEGFELQTLRSAESETKILNNVMASEQKVLVQATDIEKKVLSNIDNTRELLLEQNKLSNESSNEEFNRISKESSLHASELMEKLEKLTVEAKEQLAALREMAEKNHQETADARTDLYRQVQTDIAMALAEIKGDAENLYKPFVVKPIDGSENVKFVSETAARLAGCSFKGRVGIQHKGSFDDALILLRNETYSLNAKYLVPVKYTKIRPNGVGETMLNITVKMMDCPSKT